MHLVYNDLYSSSFIYSASNARAICERTSPHDPFAIYKKFINSLLPALSNPSAILSITEPAAARICCTKRASYLNSALFVYEYISLLNSLAFCQITKSSNLSTLAILKYYLNSLNPLEPFLNPLEPAPLGAS